ncbi:hypothetical protein [Paenibacillus sp. CF384]|uniref:hypothetical protein n=1 Tax=Paenibacillus sp. CF384 TaxID=1884382 RepID=UPI00089B2959|nr:hypothetical protein [Paenibacillus sp. CF384]SDW08674.1 hypothetical protein SAMN05518855_1001216 [Paenibacillus sp. CF384]
MQLKLHQKQLKIVIISLLLVAFVIAISYIGLNMYSRSIDVSIQGVNYQLGPENGSNIQPETVRLKGKWSRSLKGIRKFRGTITFAHETIPVPKESLETTIRFDKNGYGLIIYTYFEKSGSMNVKPRIYTYGALFANADFSAVTFTKFREVATKDDSKGSEWNGGDGLMFAGPAATRVQALRISNELMQKHLRDDSYIGGQFVLK